MQEESKGGEMVSSDYNLSSFSVRSDISAFLTPPQSMKQESESGIAKVNKVMEEVNILVD